MLATVALVGGGTWAFAASSQPTTVTPADITAAQDGPAQEDDTCAAPSTQEWCEDQIGAGRVAIEPADGDHAEALKFLTPDAGALARVSHREHIRLSELKDLAYATRILTPVGALAPSLTVAIAAPPVADTATAGIAPPAVTTLVWEPEYAAQHGGAPVGTDGWQQWTPSAGQGWIVTAQDDSLPKDGSLTLDDIKRHFQDALVLSVGINQGSGNAGLVAFADDLAINGTAYDFALPQAKTAVVRPDAIAQAPLCSKAWCEVEQPDTSTATIGLVPDTHQGAQALELATPDDEGDIRIVNRANGVRGSNLSDLTTLLYDTYQVTQSAVEAAREPALKIKVEVPAPVTGAVSGATTKVELVWEPIYASAGRAGVVGQSWQTWSASTETGWWSPQNGGDALGFRQEKATLAQVQQALQGATIDEIGIGQGDTAAGVLTHVDRLRINDVVYDFEDALAPTGTPSPSDTPTATVSPSPSGGSVPDTVTATIDQLVSSLSPSPSPSPSTSASPSPSPSATSAAPDPAATLQAIANTVVTTLSQSSSPSPSPSPSPTSASSTPSVSPSASVSASPSVSQSASPAASAASPSPSASPSASPTTSSASPSTTPTPSSSTAAPLAVAMTFDKSTTTPGVPVTVTLRGTPGAAVQLLAYSRPNTTYGVVREGTFDTDGIAAFRVTPGTNTRLYGHYRNGSTDLDSPTAVISVRTALSLSAYRDGVRQYHFQGRNLPRRPGQLITLYRVNGNGTEVRTATTKTDSTGTWRIDRTFTGSGTYTFVVRTTANVNNAAGASNRRRTVIS